MAPIVLAAMMAATTSPEPIGAEPIRLETLVRPGGVDVQVIGLSSLPLSARYRLEVSGGTGNRSTQSGNVRLTPGRTAVLIRTRISSGSDGDWSARLIVEPEQGASYERRAGAGR